MQERKQIGCLLIATNKYKQFVQQLINDIARHFLLEHDITVHLFTDEIRAYGGSERVSIKQYQIHPYKFPYATLYRYKIFDNHKNDLKNSDYLFYLDVDMAIVDNVGKEILGEGLTAVSHPGYFMNGDWGSSNCVKESMAYTPIEKRFHYCAGGFQGGRTDLYLSICNMLNARIQDDEERGVIAEWHDETHWNWLLNNSMLGNGFLRLKPDYCMVEQEHLRKLWKIDNLIPRIVALAKDHKTIRE